MARPAAATMLVRRLQPISAYIELHHAEMARRGLSELSTPAAVGTTASMCGIRCAADSVQRNEEGGMHRSTTGCGK